MLWIYFSERERREREAREEKERRERHAQEEAVNMHFQLSMEMVRKVQRPASTALLVWQKLGLMRVQLGGDGYTHLVTV